jgi:hypothetical protein
LIELTPEVWEILWSLYKTEAIYVKTIEIVWQNTFKVCCKFPKYWLSIEEPDHVSNVQMQAAFNQALYSAIWLAIRQQGINSPISYETFLLNRMHVLYRHDERTFNKEIKPWEEVYLTLQIEPVSKKWNMYSITTNFLRTKECFMFWKIECLLQEKYIK